VYNGLIPTKEGNKMLLKWTLAAKVDTAVDIQELIETAVQMIRKSKTAEERSFWKSKRNKHRDRLEALLKSRGHLKTEEVA
jgi:hypothetical protein|tara:strand:+ start:4354 stop:4596 length:243 start_codon:yes stop_codon:yes gene_type:complete